MLFVVGEIYFMNRLWFRLLEVKKIWFRLKFGFFSISWFKVWVKMCVFIEWVIILMFVFGMDFLISCRKLISLFMLRLVLFMLDR